MAMNRHHPYGGMYEGARRGNSPSGPGPDRSHTRFSYDRGSGATPRGRGRGRGGNSSASHYGSGGGYGQNASYESATPESYSQWNSSPQDYYDQSASYGEAYPPYDDGPGSYSDQGYGSYEDGSAGRGGRGARRGGAAGAGAPRRDRDDKVHDSLIEERIMRERPCRTLFIRNIKYETNSDDVRRKFDEHGEIKTFFDLIANRGMVFVTYFDLRAAERARERLQDTEISGRPIDVHYSLPRPDEQSGKDPKERNQGTLLVTLRNSASGQPIDDNEVRRRFQQFGDVKSVKPGGNIHNQRYVEYFDTRSCEDAYDRMQDQPFQDGIVDVIFSSDIPDVPLPPGPIPQRRTDDKPMRGGRDYDEHNSRGRRGGRGGPRGRGGFPKDDWERRDDWDRDRDRRYGDDYDGGGRGRGRGRGRGGGYNNDHYDNRSGGYGGAPPPSAYGHPGPSGPPPPSYGQPTGGPPPSSAPPVDERLEQARKVQQLLAALKQPQAGGQPPSAPPTMSGPPPPHMPPGGPSFYPPLPTMSGMPPQMYPGGPPPPPMTNPYGAPPPSSTPQQAASGPPPPPASASLAGLPPNILAMLQQATQGQAAASHAAPPQMPGMPSQMPQTTPYGMPPPQPPNAPPAGGAAAQDYQQLMSFLQSQARKR